jgi:hypothetical protein
MLSDEADILGIQVPLRDSKPEQRCQLGIEATDDNLRLILRSISIDQSRYAEEECHVIV